MNWWQAIIVGIIEGLTEYLPVSSTGHILLTQRILGITQSPAADAYAICVQGGAILAVAALYWRRFRQMYQGLLGKDRDGWRLLLCVSVAFVLTGIIGVALEKRIKEHLFNNLRAITAAWLVGGMAILVAGYFNRRRRQRYGERGLELGRLGLGSAALIGIAQCVAMWPGVSRSLVTIVAGLAVGLSLAAAVEFSFILGVVTLLAATGLDLVKHHGEMAANYSLGNMLLGFLAAGIAAALAVEWMVRYLRHHSLAVFGWYRVALAVVVGLLLLLKVLQ